MKIVILQGSPNKRGSTSILTESFTQGATEAGHMVERIDISSKKIKACTVSLVGTTALAFRRMITSRLRRRS